MRENIGFFLVGILYISTVYVLVRPNSNGPAIINSLFSTFADLVRGVSGETYNTSTNKWSAAS
jgi:hypothetical protein